MISPRIDLGFPQVLGQLVLGTENLESYRNLLRRISWAWIRMFHEWIRSRRGPKSKLWEPR